MTSRMLSLFLTFLEKLYYERETQVNKNKLWFVWKHLQRSLHTETIQPINITNQHHGQHHIM